MLMSVFGAGSAHRLTLANGCLLGSSEAHYELVDRPKFAVSRLLHRSIMAR